MSNFACLLLGDGERALMCWTEIAFCRLFPLIQFKIVKIWEIASYSERTNASFYTGKRNRQKNE